MGRSFKKRNNKLFKYWWTSGCCRKYSQKIISNETEYDSIEDPLNVHRTASNETAFVSAKVSYIINDKNIKIAPGQGKKPVSILNDEFCEEQAFPYLLPKGKFGYKAPQDMAISPARYFNQKLLNFNQHFPSDAKIYFLPGLYISNTTFVYQ